MSKVDRATLDIITGSCQGKKKSKNPRKTRINKKNSPQKINPSWGLTHPPTS